MVSKGLFRLSAMALLITAVMLLATHGAGASADGDKNKDQGQYQALTLPEKTELKYPNLGSHLDELVASVEEGETPAERIAEESSMRKGASVAVTIHLSGNVDEVVSFLEDNGGDPRNVDEDYVEAYVPVTLLGPVSEQAGVIRVREIVPPEPDQLAQRVVGHGPPAHGSVAWNRAGYAGQGVKVGVIDAHLAFNGFRDLMGTELPSTVQARCYTDIGVFIQNLAECEDDEEGNNHGTLVAEAVVDIAPQASLYIASPLSRGDVRNAVDWMVSEGVSVIARAVSSIYDGPGDGTSSFSDSPLRTVDRAVAGGVVWVQAAGNHAQRTWFARAPYLDRDGDGLIEFAVGDEVNDITLEAGDRLVVQLRWDDKWGGATRDLDLSVQSATEVEAISADSQSGDAGHIPMEVIAADVIRSGKYGVVVEHAGGSVPDWVQLMVWRVESIEHYTKNGSVTNPSESANPGMLAVGAAHWNDVRAIEYYSGRGPTPDGRVKPDIVGADCGETALRHLDEYNVGFCGTSQSAPHMAGLAALVRQRFPEYTPAQVASYLKDNAAQRQMPDPNNTWGHGFAKLPPPDGSGPRVPAPSNAFVRNPAGDFDTLIRAFNWAPQGIWSDGTTMWVADWLNAKLYAYDAVTKARVPGRDFDTLTAAGNTWPGGIWSDGTTMWVADWLDQEIYAYDMASKARVSGKEFNTLEAAGNALPQGIWSDGTTMWVVDLTDEKIYAYDMETRARVPRQDYDTLRAAGNTWPGGIWSDGTTMWVADSNTEKIYAYDMASKARVSGKEFNTVEAAGNALPQGIWSDGTTIWVVDREDGKIYAYFMPKESAADKEALIAFYNATGGVSWTNNANWLTSSPIGQWHGVTTDDDGRVTHLALSQNQLSGEIPTELGSLANLEELYLWGNQLTGEIPAELGDLANLEELYLSDNQLSGEIPTELGGLANLEALDLWDNQLTGEIPSELRNLANLTVLSLSQNQLTGPVPTWLGSLANLEKLYLSDNQLTGEIPQSLTGLAALTRFYFINNPGLCAPVDEAFQTWLRSIALVRGSSCAPVDSRDDRAVLVELYNSTGGENWNESANWLSDRPIREWNGVTNDANGRVNGLYLVRNQLAGEIPSELGGLSNLEVLLLNDNRLTGTIPTELGGLSNLLWVDLSGNQLTGCIPHGLRNVPFNDFDDLPFCVVEFPADETGERSVAENTGTGMPIGDPVQATSSGATLTYTLGGPDAASFAIVPGTGQIMTKGALDYEARASYAVTITARDPGGESATKSVTITVTDVDELGMVSGDDTVDYAENGTDAVATYTADGPDAASATWSLSGDDAGDFTITGGVLAFRSAPDHESPADADGDNVYEVMVQAEAGGEMDEVAVTVTVTDVDEMEPQPGTVLERYDDNGDGGIDQAEVEEALYDYFFGQPRLSQEDVEDVLELYFFP